MQYDFEKVDELIENDIANGFPGAVLQISQNGKVIKHSAYGYKLRYNSEYKEIPFPERMELDTVFDLASNTKIFATTFVAMVMVEKGLLDLDEPLISFLPDFYIHNDITPRMLLSHCAGYGPEIWFFDNKNSLGKEFYSQERELTERLLLKAPLEYEPLSKTVYSDTGFMLLGIVIEYILGKDLSEATKELIYSLLKLKNTTFLPLRNGIEINQIAATSLGNTSNGTMDYPNIRKDLIRGEVQDEKAFYSMGGIAGHAGLFSTSSDVIRMCETIQEVYHEEGDRLFSREKLIDFLTATGPDGTFGCGWRLNKGHKVSNLFSSRASELTIGHTGFTGTMTLIDLENHLSIVLLTNKVHSRCYERVKYSGGIDFATGRYERVADLIYKSMNL